MQKETSQISKLSMAAGLDLLEIQKSNSWPVDTVICLFCLSCSPVYPPKNVLRLNAYSLNKCISPKTGHFYMLPKEQFTGLILHFSLYIFDFIGLRALILVYYLLIND